MRPRILALLALITVAAPCWAAPSFVPGNHVLFSDDFSRDPLGQAPRQWSIEHGAFTVAARGLDQWLSLNGSEGEARMKLAISLPKRWTLEFDLLHERSGEIGVTVAGLDRDGHELWSLAIGELDGTTIRLDAFDYQSSTVLANGGSLRDRRHVAISAQDGELIAFLGGAKVASMPAIPEAAGTASLAFRVRNDDSHALVSAVRLAGITDPTSSEGDQARAAR